MVDGLAVRLRLEPSVVDSDVDDVVEQSRLLARSLASSIRSRAVRVAALAPLALSRCWEGETVFEAAVMESSSLWNLRFEVAMASGMFVVKEWGLWGLVPRRQGSVWRVDVRCFVLLFVARVVVKVSTRHSCTSALARESQSRRKEGAMDRRARRSAKSEPRG